MEEERSVRDWIASGNSFTIRRDSLAAVAAGAETATLNGRNTKPSGGAHNILPRALPPHLLHPPHLPHRPHPPFTHIHG